MFLASPTSPYRAEPTELVFWAVWPPGRCTLPAQTTPAAGAVHVAGLCDRDWVQRNTLGNAKQAIKQKITRHEEKIYWKQIEFNHFYVL